MNSDLILIELLNPGIMQLTLNRSDKRNALNIPLLKSLVHTLENLHSDIRVIIFRGNGPIFCSGLDLLEASQSINEEESANLLAKAFQLVYQLPLVSMAYIQGAAMGGGAGLACACDFILIDENAFISFPEVRRGLVPAQVLVLLKKQLNEKQLKEVVLLGEKIKSDKAYEMGLVTKVIPSDNIEAALLTFANQFLKGSPEAIQQTKCLINKLSSRLLSEEFDIAQKFHHLSRQSIHAKEGMKAFLEKRKASWEI